MKYLLDTHTIIWTLDETENLSQSAKNIIESSDDLYVSIASFWEIAIKKNLKKLDVNGSIREMVYNCIQLGINILNIMPQHLDELENLPTIHKDPFDRILIAQTRTEGMTLITKDEIIPEYDVSVLW